MASILIAGGFLAYEKVAAKRAKKAERKAEKKAHDRERFSELERENAERIRALQEKTEFCGRSDWDAGRGGGCGGGGGGGAQGMQRSERAVAGGGDAQGSRTGTEYHVGGQGSVVDGEGSRPAERTSEEARRTSRENPFAAAATTTLPSSTPSPSAHLQSQPHQLHHQPDQQRHLLRTPTSATTGSTENQLLDNYARSHQEDDAERQLQVPDVRGVMPVYRDEKVCRKSLKQRVLRRRGPCEGGGVR